MAHNVEPMDIDCDFDNKENSVLNSNVYPRTPCTEKGYEELDVSELNMKLRYSVTPVSSPMSKSYTANCIDNKNLESGDDHLNANLTRSFNSALPKNDTVNKSLKSMPLQAISADQFLDKSRNASVLRPLDSTLNVGDVTVTVSLTKENVDNYETPSSSSSMAQTPEVTTPTKELPRTDGGSPIMRGLKSVLNMFRPSQSPISAAECGEVKPNQILSPTDIIPHVESSIQSKQAVLASTPIAANKNKESVKRASPLKESIIFNEDLERELLWKDETTILFSEEKIPIHKLFYQPSGSIKCSNTERYVFEDNLNTTTEYMDISCNDSIVRDQTMTEIQQERYLNVGESDGEFVDCETTLNNDKSEVLPAKDTNINVVSENKAVNQISVTDIQLTQLNNETTSLTESLPICSSISETVKVDLEQTSEIEDHMFKPKEIEQLPVDNANNTLINKEGDTAGPVSHNMINTDESKSIDHTNNGGITQESIELLPDVHQSKFGLNIESIQTETIKSEDVPAESISSSKLNVLDIKIESNHTETDPMLTKELDETALTKSLVDDKNAYIEKLYILPANIPLPDEDNFECEIGSNIDVSLMKDETNYELPINIVKTFDTNLGSTPHVDSVPIDLAVLANNNENKAICSDIDIASLDINVKESKSNVQQQHSSISTPESETTTKNDPTPIVGDFTLGIKTDIDNIVKEAEYIFEEKQIKLNEVSANFELKEDGHSQSYKENIIVSTEPTLLSESPLNGCNEAVSSVPISELDIIGNVEVSIVACNFDTNNEKIINQSKDSGVTQSETPCHNDIVVDDFQSECQEIGPVESAIDNQCSSYLNEIVDTVSVGNEKHIENEFVPLNDTNELSNVIKTELLPDVIPEAIVCDVPEQIPVENAAEKKSKDIDENKVEIVTNEKLYENKDEVEDNIDEDVLLSENNSPFVSIAGEIIQTQELPLDLETTDPFATKTKIAVSPPVSPKISSKGYNFNFDEIDDPFGTKTKMRLSPLLNSPRENTEITTEKTPPRDKNRRKSQPERKKPITSKKAINKTVSVSENIFDQKGALQTNKSSKIEETIESCNPDNSLSLKSNRIDNITQNKDSEPISKPLRLSTEKLDQPEDKPLKDVIESTENLSYHEEEKSLVEVVPEKSNSLMHSFTRSNEINHPSSSEQSTYYSAEMSGESTKNKNVFNIPEIDDENFNPFITKSNICDSPPPSINDSLSYKSNYAGEESCSMNKSSEALEDREGNISTLTCSSKATEDKDVTVREVHTEDEDTIEGPFLETEDLNNVDKFFDFDSEDVDMIQFSGLPQQNNDEMKQLEGEEMFIDAEAFEFLLNQNKSNVVLDSGKESLFLKFDPLFAKRVSTDGVLAALHKIQKKQSTPKKISVAQQLDITFENPISGPSNVNTAQNLNKTELIKESSEDLNVTVTKPMMVVTPAVNPIVTPRNKSVTPTSSNRRSITFSSPAIAVIDRLLSMSANNSLIGYDTTMSQVSTEQNEADHALTELRELLAEKEIHVYNLRSESKELKDRLSTMETQMRSLEAESEERLKKINDLNEKLTEKTKINKSMAAVVEEYERTIASLIAESEQDKKRNNEERIRLIKERDEQTAHLASMEGSFSDLHSKYEKSKQIILTCKANEDACKKSIKEFEDNLTKMQYNYELLKQHATSKLNYANQELEKMNKSHEAEVLKLNAMIKRKELHITSLEETLAQKTKANEELTAICDELINKVG